MARKYSWPGISSSSNHRKPPARQRPSSRYRRHQEFQINVNEIRLRRSSSRMAGQHPAILSTKPLSNRERRPSESASLVATLPRRRWRGPRVLQPAGDLTPAPPSARDPAQELQGSGAPGQQGRRQLQVQHRNGRSILRVFRAHSASFGSTSIICNAVLSSIGCAEKFPKCRIASIVSPSPNGIGLLRIGFIEKKVNFCVEIATPIASCVKNVLQTSS